MTKRVSIDGVLEQLGTSADRRWWLALDHAERELVVQQQLLNRGVDS